MTVHVAYLADRGEGFWFASLDGEAWLSVTRQPTEQDEDSLHVLLDGESKEEFDRKHERFIPFGYHEDGGRMKPMTFGTRYLREQGAEFYENEARVA